MADALRAVVERDLNVLASDAGEVYTIPGTNSSVRFVADQKTAPFALIHSRSMPDHPVPSHEHKYAIDTWCILQGKIQVWAGDKAAILCPGDIAFVPNGFVHSYQILEPHTEHIGLIHPAEWVDFFRVIAEPWTGKGPYPSNDKREFPVHLFVQAIKDGHDVIPRPNHVFPATPTFEGTTGELPKEPVPYFLRAHHGPRWALGGLTCGPMALPEASLGRFSICVIEGADDISHPKDISRIRIPRHISFFIQTGSFAFDVDGKKKILTAGEVLHLRPESEVRFEAAAVFARAWVFADGAGLEQIFMAAGEPIEGIIGCTVPEVTEAVKAKADAAAKEFGFAFV